MSLAANANAIIDLQDVKSYLRLPAGDCGQDDFLQFWINAVSDAIEGYIRGPIVVQTFQDEIHDGDGTPWLILDHQPVVSLQNDFPQDVMYRDDPAQDWNVLEPEPAYIIIDKNAPWGVWLYREVFPHGRQNVKICYNAGYEAVPGAIAQVCVESVAEIFKESNQGSGRLGQRSRSIGGIRAAGAADVFVDLIERHRSMLAPFTRLMP